jgi:hypothetical protein
MKNKLFVILCLLFAGVLLIPCYGQQNRRVRRAKEPEVPKMALLPKVSKTHFEQNVNKFLDWVDSLHDAPATVREYSVNPRKYKFMSPSEIKQKVLGFRSLIQHPDLEEVTGHSRNWYIRIYNAALPMIQASDVIYGMRSMPSAQKYNSALASLHKSMNAVLDASETKPQRLSREQLIRITNQNRERRKKEWLKWYYADQKRKAQEAAQKGKNNRKDVKEKSSRRKQKESAR